MQFSHFDLEFTANSDAEVQQLQAAVTAYLKSSADLPERMAELLNADTTQVASSMPMAMMLQCYLIKLAAHPKLGTTLQDLLVRIQTSECNDRERRHLAALDAWVKADDSQCLARLEAIVDDYPQDMIALRIAHYLHFYNGNGGDMARSTSRVLDDWPEDHAHYSFLLGMHAFGLEEQDQYAAAESFASRALKINPADLWSIHAMDHIFYMQNQHQSGIAWLLEQAVQSQGTNNFRHHLVWHRALHHLASAQFDQVLEIYDQELTQCIEDDFYLDVCNNSALLWWLDEAGVSVGNRWAPLAEIASQHATDRELMFASLHYLLPLLKTQAPEVVQHLQNLEIWSHQNNHQGLVCRDVGLNTAELMRVRAQNRLTNKTKSIPQLERIGGSKAQRSLFSSTHTLR
jgi:tetratricopeptide (TPR) repeat protein